VYKPFTTCSPWLPPTETLLALCIKKSHEELNINAYEKTVSASITVWKFKGKLFFEVIIVARNDARKRTMK